MIGIGVGIGRSGSMASGSLAQTLADLYVARVATITNFVVPSYARVVAGYDALINAYATGTKAAFETATAMFADPSVSGYVLGTGTGLTAGAACARVGNMAWFDDNSRDLVQATPLNQPWLLVHTGTNYVAFPGVAGNFVSTSSISPVGSTQLDVKVKLNGGNPLATRTITAQDSGVGEGRIFGLEWVDATTGTIRFFFNSGFSSSVVSASGVGVIANYTGWIRATYSTDGTTATITFFSSANGTSWTQLSQTTAASARLGNANAPINIGANNAANLYQGNIERVIVSNTIDGVATRDFNPALYNASVSQTTIPSSTGEVYTLNVGTASTGFKAAFVDRTIMQGDGVNSRLTSGALTSRQFFTRYAALNPLNLIGPQYIIDGNPTEKHLLWKQGANIGFYNDANLIVTPTANRSSLFTGDYNNASSKFRINAGADNTGTTGTGTSTIVNIFTAGNGIVAANAIVNTLIDTGAGVINTDAQKTAIYNYIRSINNNAF